MVRVALLGGLVAACSFQGGAAGVGVDAAVSRDGSRGPGSDSGPGRDSGRSDAGSAVVVDGFQAGVWNCGPQPPAPPSTVSDQPGGADLTMSSIVLSGGETGNLSSGQVVVAAGSAMLQLALHFTLTDARCAECQDQLEVGWMQGSSGPRSGCAWDDGVPNPGGVEANIANFAITAPSTPGAYDLRTNIGQDNFCGDHSPSWWANEVPAADTTIAKLCVQ